MIRDPTTNSVEYQSVSLSGLTLLFDDIAHATNGLQPLLVEGPIDFLAKPTDQDVDDVGLRVEVVLPDVRQDHRLRDHFPGVAHQILEERELSWTEIDGRPRARHTPGE